MGITVVLLFPLGAIFQRLIGGWILHALFQTFALFMLIAGFGLGVELAKMTDAVCLLSLHLLDLILKAESN